MNFEEIASFAKILKLFSETNNLSNEEKILKLITAHLKPEQKKNAEIIIKYIEFENMAKRYKNEISMQNYGNCCWQKNMLTDLKKTFSEKKQIKLDLILKIMDLSETAQKL